MLSAQQQTNVGVAPRAPRPSLRRARAAAVAALPSASGDDAALNRRSLLRSVLALAPAVRRRRLRATQGGTG
jgi:hypothetical protein